MNLTQLQRLPDEDDETLGGLMTADELMLELSQYCVTYTPEQRIQAATVWTVTGNIKETARQTGISEAAIKWWRRRSRWWPELIRQIRKSKQEELDGMLTGLIMDGVEELKDRVKNGNTKVFVSEDGQRHEYRVPLSSSELSKDALGIPFDKRALLRGDPTSRTEKTGEDTKQLLSQLARNFEAFAKQIKPGFKPPDIVEGEIIEATN